MYAYEMEDICVRPLQVSNLQEIPPVMELIFIDLDDQCVHSYSLLFGRQESFEGYCMLSVGEKVRPIGIRGGIYMGYPIS